MRQFIITVGGKRYEVGVEEVGASEEPAKKVPVAASAPQAAPVAPGKGEAVKAPFGGLIKGLNCASGDRVKKGQTILVLEAMKMDNEISAPCDGVVTYQVQKGANVDTDAVLAVIGE